MRHLPEASQRGRGRRARRVVVPRDLRQPVGEQSRVDSALADFEGRKGILDWVSARYFTSKALSLK